MELGCEFCCCWVSFDCISSFEPLQNSAHLKSLVAHVVAEMLVG